MLDLSGNKLNELPDEIAGLKKLKIGFFSANNFEIFPEILGKLPLLEMIGFKSNRINLIAENALPTNLRWLILTQNQLTEIPKSIGTKKRLQKCMLAGNQLASLPIEMQNCTNLELLRISANQFQSLPDWLWNLPKLAWLAYGENLFNQNLASNVPTESFDWNKFTIEKQLGEGASGIISKAIFNMSKEQVALKIFKGQVTSDGLPKNEMEACIQAGAHPNLIKIKGNIENHPEQKQGLVMELLCEKYYNLGGPPSFETCTRDVFNSTKKYTIAEIIKIVKQTAETCLHFHESGIMHGDLYAHNILIDTNCHTIISDFGAATLYKSDRQKHEKIEIRAWACLLEDLLDYVLEDKNQMGLIKLIDLKNKCMQENANQRPDFVAVLEELNFLHIFFMKLEK